MYIDRELFIRRFVSECPDFVQVMSLKKTDQWGWDNSHQLRQAIGTASSTDSRGKGSGSIILTLGCGDGHCW